eukprot:Nk52_evm5s1779 gene=Nk52_evmTU5s1779
MNLMIRFGRALQQTGGSRPCSRMLSFPTDQFANNINGPFPSRVSRVEPAVNIIHARFAGHNKWSKIKRDKASNDQKRSVAFNKFSYQITAAVVEGGETDNIRLNSLLDRAKEMRMPKDTIQKAIDNAKKPSSGERVLFEAKGPGRTSWMIEGYTTSVPSLRVSVRKTLSKNEGVLLDNGSISFQFEHKGIVVVKEYSDDLLELNEDIDVSDIVASVVDADFSNEDTEGGEVCHVICKLEDTMRLYRLYEEMESVKPLGQRIAYVPKTDYLVHDISDEEVASIQALEDALEENMEVMNIYHNASTHSE